MRIEWVYTDNLQLRLSLSNCQPLLLGRDPGRRGWGQAREGAARHRPPKRVSLLCTRSHPQLGPRTSGYRRCLPPWTDERPAPDLSPATSFHWTDLETEAQIGHGESALWLWATGSSSPTLDPDSESGFRVSTWPQNRFNFFRADTILMAETFFCNLICNC